MRAEPGGVSCEEDRCVFMFDLSIVSYRTSHDDISLRDCSPRTCVLCVGGDGEEALFSFMCTVCDRGSGDVLLVKARSLGWVGVFRGVCLVGSAVCLGLFALLI